MGDCINCVFKGVRVGSKGPIDSPFVIVGESPGIMEIHKKIPFVGPSGALLDTSLKTAWEQLGHQPIEPYITNAFQCLPKDKSPQKVAAACKSCFPRLNEELLAHPRKLIIALGNAALWSITGDYDLKITRERGKLFKSRYSEMGVLACLHPAFILRGTGSIEQFAGDLKYGIELLTQGNEAITDYQEPSYTVVDSDELYTRFLAWLNSCALVAGDIETSGFNPLTDRILCLGVCEAASPLHSWILPPEYIHPEIFEGKTRWSWQNGKFDTGFLRQIGCKHARVDEDTMLMSYALNERGIHDLDQIASDWLRAPNHKKIIAQYLPNTKTSYEVIPKPVLYKYLALDVCKTAMLTPRMLKALEADPKTEKLYKEVFIPASEYLLDVQSRGLYVDRERVAQNAVEFGAEAAIYKEQLNVISRRVIGIDINPNSPKQLQNLLYRHLKLAPETTGTGKEVLKKLPPHEAIKALQKYRKVQKALSTYIIPMDELVQADGCVHTTFLIHGTVTGRLSSRNPNIQNIPRLPSLRGQFIARPGYIYVEADLSQAELRSLAYCSGDPELCRIYTTEGLSVHDEVRKEIFGDPEDWSPEQLEAYFERFGITEKDVERLLEEQKMIAKNVNFGIVYGITPAGLSEQINRPFHECARYIDAWFRRFPVAKAFIEKCRQSVTKSQTITTQFGRKKRAGYVPRDKIQAAENEASNFPHQATASDITLTTGIRIYKTLQERWGAYIVNTVHDSMLIEVPIDQDKNEVALYVCAELEKTPILWGITRVPFKADVKVGTRWGNLEKYKVNPKVDHMISS